MLKRYLNLDLPKGQSLFLWGPRKTGKSTFLKALFHQNIYIDFLQHDTFLHYSKYPHRLREELLENYPTNIEMPIIIDEVQKVPEILDEVHWMIENIKDISFILCGSSLRKLKITGSNLLGGRAWRQLFLPLCYKELPTLDLLKIFNHGLIPSHYLSNNIPTRSLQGYLTDYLIPEIQWESHIRQIGSFNRFLEAMAYSNGEIINFSNIARECSIQAKTVQAYIDLLVEMLLGYLIFPFTKTKSRQLITAAPKFYFFDTGIVSILKGLHLSQIKGQEAGHLLEQYIFLELIAYKELNNKQYDINYWRTKSGLEVDFIVHHGNIAIETKINNNIEKKDIHGLIEFTKEYQPKLSIIVCLETKARTIKINDNLKIHVLPIEVFLEQLWENLII